MLTKALGKFSCPGINYLSHDDEITRPKHPNKLWRERRIKGETLRGRNEKEMWEKGREMWEKRERLGRRERKGGEHCINFPRY